MTYVPIRGFAPPAEPAPAQPRTLAGELAAAIADPGGQVPRMPGEPLTHWCARAVLALLTSRSVLLEQVVDALGGDTGPAATPAGQGPATPAGSRDTGR